MRADVAVLYVDPGGPYPKLVRDWYDERRNADAYAGPLPVVAHPPCKLWVNFAALNYKRWGGDHNRPGNDGGRFMRALATVRRFGGVLEHPAGIRAWPRYGLTAPEGGSGWAETSPGEWVCEVWQSAYGHRARKRTWLFYCGNVAPLEARWERAPGTHQVGWFDRVKPTLGKREASRTPVAFAEWLLEVASRCRRGSVQISLSIG